MTKFPMARHGAGGMVPQHLSPKRAVPLLRRGLAMGIPQGGDYELQR